MHQTKDSKYRYMSWDCPNDLEQYPYSLAVEIWQRRQAGLPHMELSAKGETAIMLIGEIVELHRKAMWQPII